MKYLLTVLLFIFSTQAFSQQASCFNVFAEKNQEPFTVDSLYSLKFKKTRIPLAAVTFGATVTGVGASLGAVPMAIIGLPSGVMAAGMYSFAHSGKKAMFERFKTDLLSKYSHEENTDLPSHLPSKYSHEEKAALKEEISRTNMIRQAVFFINNGISKNDSRRLIQFLISQGEDINYKHSLIFEGKDMLTGYTPMHEAVKGDNPVAIQMLYELGGSIHIKDSQGRTPLDLAIELKSKKAQKALSRISIMEQADGVVGKS